MMADFLNCMLYVLSLTLNKQGQIIVDTKELWTSFLVFYHGPFIKRLKSERHDIEH
jgi:hypothetical protein